MNTKWYDSPIWQFIGVIVAFFTFVLSYYPVSLQIRYAMIVSTIILLIFPIVRTRFIAASNIRGLAKFLFLVGKVLIIAGMALFMTLAVLYYSEKYRKICLEYIEKQEFELAADNCGYAILINPFNYNNFLARGLMHYNNESYEYALSDFNDAIRINDTFPQAFIYRGLIYLKIKNPKSAIRNFTTSIDLESSSRAYWYRGKAYMDLDDLDGAINDYNNAIKIDGKFSEPYYDRALALKKQGRLEDAISDIRRYMDFKDKMYKEEDIQSILAQTYKELGYSYYDKNEYYSAISSFSDAINIMPLSDTYRNRGDSYIAAGNIEKGLADFERAISIDKKNTAAYYSRAVVFKNMNKIEASISDFERFLEIGGDDSLREKARLFLFDLYQQAGFKRYDEKDFKEAVNAFSRSLSIREDSDVYRNRGDAYAAQGDLMNARRDFDRALNINPNNPSALYSRGFLFKQIGNNESAIMDFENCLRLGPSQTIREIVEKTLKEMRKN